MLEKFVELRKDLANLGGISGWRKAVLLACVNFMIEFIQDDELRAGIQFDVLETLYGGK